MSVETPYEPREVMSWMLSTEVHRTPKLLVKGKDCEASIVVGSL